MNSLGSDRSAVSSPSSSQVNYDSPAVLELELDGTQFRIDSGKQGTSLCISQRAAGSWDWAFIGEAKWDGSLLRSKALDRRVLQPLSVALAKTLADLEC
jgi:hypothetical protein